MRADSTTSWAQTSAICGACGATVPATAAGCPQCRQTTGPFTARVATARLRTDDAGVAWLHGPRGDRRRLTAEQARWLNPRRCLNPRGGVR